MYDRFASRSFVTALMILVTFGFARAVTIVPNGALKKGDTVMITASFTGSQSWIRNGVTLSSCLMFASTCTPASSGNMAFSASSLTSNSTMTITGADQGLNGGNYAVASETTTLTINSPIAAVEIIGENIGTTTATIVARIRCVFPMSALEVTFQSINQNGVNSSEVFNNNNLVAADNSSCASYESAFNVTKTYYSGGVDEKFQVIVCGKHSPLNITTCSSLSSSITFQGGCGGPVHCKDWIIIIIIIIIVLIIVAVSVLLYYYLYERVKNLCLTIWAVQQILVVITIVLDCVLIYKLWFYYSLETVLPSVILPSYVIVVLGTGIMKRRCRTGSEVEEEATKTVTQEAVMGENTTLLEDILFSFGNSLYSVAWSFLDIPVRNDDKYHGGQNDHPGLTIADLTENDAGTYKCIVLLKEKTNTIRKEFNVELTIIDIVRTSIGSSAHLEVKRVRLPPFDDCIWSFENTNITPGEKYSVDPSNSLTMNVQNVDLNDAGRYICNFKMKESVVNSYIFDVVISVTQEAHIGKSTTLLKDKLLVFKNSINSVEWSFEGKEIQIRRDKKYHVGQNYSPELTITGLAQEDAGSYTCIVWLKGKPKTFSKKINVELKIIVSQEASIGESTTLLKDISLFLGHSIHSVTWFFCGKEIQIQSDKRYDGGQIKSPGLTIIALTEYDAGRYSCIIWLKEKTSTIQKKFDVELKIKVQHETTAGLTITLLKELKFKKTKSVTWFFSEKELHVSSDGRYQGGTKTSPALLIIDLRESDAGTYKCRIAQKDKEHIWERHYVIELNIKAKPKELKKDDNATTEL